MSDDEFLLTFLRLGAVAQFGAQAYQATTLFI